MKLTINGMTRTVDVPEDMPLLWVLRDVIGLTGTKFGCGIASCGACTVHIDGQATRSCVTPVSTLAGKQVTTIEAIGETSTGKKIQNAWIALEVPQCGYCQSGQIMSASALLAKNPAPTDADIDSAMSGNIAAAAPMAGFVPPSSRLPVARVRRKRSLTMRSGTGDGFPGATSWSSMAAAGGGLYSGAAPMSPGVRGQSGSAASPPAFAPNAYVRVGTDDVVTVILPQAEMGQGIYTALPMLVAEELEIGLDQVRVEHAPADDRIYANPGLGFQATGGSIHAGILRADAAGGGRRPDHAGCRSGGELGCRPRLVPGREGHGDSLRDRAKGDLRRGGGAAAKLPVPTKVNSRARRTSSCSAHRPSASTRHPRSMGRPCTASTFGCRG